MSEIYINLAYAVVAGIGLILGWRGYNLIAEGDERGRRYQLIGGLILGGCIVVHFLGCASAPPPPPPVIVQAPTPTPTPTPPIDPNSALPPDAMSAMKSGSTEMVQTGIADFYRYDPNSEWEINVQPFTATEIRLAPDETTSEDNVSLGDSERWDAKIGDHTVLVKAKASNVYLDPKTGKRVPGDFDVRGNVVIATTQGRVYHIELRLKKPVTPVIAWYYSESTPAAASTPIAATTPTTQEAAK